MSSSSSSAIALLRKPVVAYFLPTVCDNGDYAVFHSDSASSEDVREEFAKWVERKYKFKLHPAIIEFGNSDFVVIYDGDDARRDAAQPNEILTECKFPVAFRGPVCFYKPDPNADASMVQSLPRPFGKEELMALLCVFQ